MRFDQRHVQLWAQNSYRKPGKAGAGTDIRNAKITWRKVQAQKKAFTIVKSDSIFFPFDPREIQRAIPFT